MDELITLYNKRWYDKQQKRLAYLNNLRKLCESSAKSIDGANKLLAEIKQTQAREDQDTPPITLQQQQSEDEKKET